MAEQDYFHHLNELHRRLQTLDDRGLVLCLAAFAEDSLADLLRAYMHKNAAAKRLIDGYDAPLGAFSARIQAAFALGLITKGQYHDLDHLRSIRNSFAHTWMPIDLNEDTVLKHIKALSYSNVVEEFPKSPREKLEGSISFTLVELRIAVTQIRQQRLNPPVLGSRLYAGLSGSPEESLKVCLAKMLDIETKLVQSNGEEKEFLQHLRRCWIEKTMRAISHLPKADWSQNISSLLKYAQHDELKMTEMYSRER